MKPVLQVALDFLELKRALELAAEAVRGGADWLEAGTPLIKSAGLDAVRELRRAFPKHTIVADLKTMDAGRIEMEFGERDPLVLEPGGIARVDPATVRRIRNVGDGDAVYVVVGGKDGYVGRDGRVPDDDEARYRATN